MEIGTVILEELGEHIDLQCQQEEKHCMLHMNGDLHTWRCVPTSYVRTVEHVYSV